MRRSLTTMRVRSTHNSDGRAVATGRMTLFQASGLMLAGRLLGQGMEVLSHFILARGLGPLTYGLYRVLLEVVQALGAFARLGSDSAALVLIPRYQAKRQGADTWAIVCWSLTLPVLTGLLFTAVAWGAAPILAVCCVGGLSVRAVRLAAMLVPVHALLLGAGATTRGFQVLLPQLTTVYLIGPGVKLLLVVSLLSWGLMGALSATGLGTGVGAGVAMGWLLRLAGSARAVGSRRPAHGLRTLASTAWPLFLGDLLSLIVLRTSVFLLAANRPVEEVGIYGVALQVANQILFIGEASVALMTPKAAWHWARGEYGDVRQLLRQARRAALAFALPTLAAFVLLGLPALGLLGPAYRAGYRPLLLLGAGHTLAASLSGAGWGLIATGRTRWWLADLAVAGVVHLIAGIVLIPSLGMVGAALAQAGSLVLLYLIAWQQITRLVAAQLSETTQA